jgi:hypothetical protein
MLGILRSGRGMLFLNDAQNVFVLLRKTGAGAGKFAE